MGHRIINGTRDSQVLWAVIHALFSQFKSGGNFVFAALSALFFLSLNAGAQHYTSLKQFKFQ